ncbi:MAG TPA: tetratricopeptide repeat protein [Planctomycetota bacterium]|nr:tetratricopeptide repeat protein [Planctomycetota bacterium]
MTDAPPVPWLQPKTKKQFVLTMSVLAVLLLTSVGIMVWFATRVPAVPPVIQKSRNLFEDRKYDEAIALLLPVIQEIEKTRSAEDPTLVKHFDLLAQIYEATGKHAQAEPLWRRSMQIRSKALGAEHPEVIGSGDKLAMSLVAQKKFPEAEALLKKSLSHREGAFGPDDSRLMPSLNRLAELYVAEGKFSEAESHAKRAVEIGRGTIGLQPPSFGDSQRWLGAALAGLGKFGDAAPLYANALAIKVKQLPEAAHIPPKPGQIAHADFADLCKEAAAVYRNAGKIKDAQELEDKAELILHPKQ